ncbi:MAG: hypothetical protein HYU66_23080, partial [Armatimonadetes bacterium]|nr:hypothetical protein [Armatimonadota bacterium]
MGGDSGVVLDLQGEEGDYYRVAGVADLQLDAEALVSARLVRWDGNHYFHGRVEPWPRSPRDLLGPPPEPAEDGRMAPGAGFDGLVMTRRRWLRERRLRP